MAATAAIATAALPMASMDSSVTPKSDATLSGRGLAIRT
jgi:hypothetical protein